MPDKRTPELKYFFVDESGDSTFFNRKGECIVGTKGCSPILILGFIKTSEPHGIRKALAELRKEISDDPYLQDIPSVAKSRALFHAKDDCPEVREKVFKLLKTLDFKAHFIVARKRVETFIKRHHSNENIFYNEIVSRLFENCLHKDHNIIYFSKRGSQTNQAHFMQSIQTAILNFEEKAKKKVETQTEILIQVPTDEPCLQVVDYLNWIVYRAFVKQEMRYFNFLKEKIVFLCDIYDFKKYPKNFYSHNKFDITKISPLELGE